MNSLNALTGLRFVAAICIVIAHLTGAGYRPFGSHIDFSAAGMPLFFTLSGFIIHYVYAAGFQRSWLHMAREFAVARFSRLYPLFIFLLIYSVLFTNLGNFLTDHPLIALSFATMTGSWWYWNIDGVSLIQLQYGLSWSVSTEIFFYIVYALVIYRISAVRSLWGAVAALIVFSVFSYSIVYVVLETREYWEKIAQTYLASYIPADSGERFGNSFFRWVIYVSPYLHSLEFIAGVLTCQIFLLMRQRSIALTTGQCEALCWAGVAWIGAGLAFNANIANLVTMVPEWVVYYIVILNFMNMNFLLAPGCCALILALADGNCVLKRVLAAGACVALGELSYSIYLAHPTLSQIAYVPRDSNHPVIGYIMVAVFLVIFCDALYRWIELPSKVFLRRLALGRIKHSPGELRTDSI